MRDMAVVEEKGRVFYIYSGDWWGDSMLNCREGISWDPISDVPIDWDDSFVVVPGELI